MQGYQGRSPWLVGDQTRFGHAGRFSPHHAHTFRRALPRPRRHIGASCTAPPCPPCSTGTRRASELSDHCSSSVVGGRTLLRRLLIEAGREAEVLPALAFFDPPGQQILLTNDGDVAAIIRVRRFFLPVVLEQGTGTHVFWSVRHVVLSPLNGV